MEALDVQERKRASLEQQAETASSATPDADERDDEKAEKARLKALRRAEQIPQRLLECERDVERLLNLKTELAAGLDLATVRRSMEDECGLASRLANYDVDAHAHSQWGRPDGFDGLVIESPRGVPVLVARKAFSDELLRRVARGQDLFYHVREGSGSRVLLRTSMCRQLTRSPRECQEFAADLAAFFSGARRHDEVEVMFTDPRHVAKRGSRVGQMKFSKRLGTLWARPQRVAEVARGAQEEQGWLY